MGIEQYQQFIPASVQGWSRVRVQNYQPETHRQWIKQHINGQWDVWAMDYFFEDEKDATLFALTWV